MVVPLIARIAPLLVLILIGRPAIAEAAPTALPDFTGLVQQVSPAVVNISTTSKKVAKGGGGRQLQIPDLPEDSPLRDFFQRFFGEIPDLEEGPGGPGGPGGGSGGRKASLGSGFIISKDGYIVSNYHVVKDADEVIVGLPDRREVAAKIVGKDERSDLAVLKINVKGDLPVVKIGTSTDLKVGEWVLAIGSPFGFEHSVTAGIVSAKGRSLPNENYVPFIQTDVAINPGNSGGPLLNLRGEVVGVNSQIYSRTGGFMGLSFAIPIDVVMDVYKQLKEKGSVSRGWLGVLIQDVNQELAESFGMEKPIGALVSKVLPKSPAGEAGVQVGDVIVEFNGKRIERSPDLPPLVGTTHAGDKIPVKVLRAGKEQAYEIKIAELPADEEIKISQTADEKPDRVTSKVLKITVVDQPPGKKGQPDQEQGVLVEKVEDGPASEGGMQKGDIILQINQKKVRDIHQFEEMVARLPRGGRPVPILVQRHGNPIFVTIRIR
jgi:serine protease Do